MNVLERIAHWSAVRPTTIAHISGERKLTFAELEAGGNAVSAGILERCGKDRAPIAVIGHREPEMLIAFLGVVKSGRPYVPIDTTLPAERVKHILAVARPALILTPTETAELCQSGGSAPPQSLQSDDPFYIIFTSGSTGTPKGIVISAGCLDHFIGWMLGQQRFTPSGEIFLNQAPFSFDLSVMDLYCSLTTGGTLFSINRDLLESPKSLYRALKHSGLTTWVSTPSFAEMCLVERTFNQDLLPSIRRFLFCGETLSPHTARRLLDRFPKAEIWNLYGPTEATVATASVRVDRDFLEKYSTLPIGRPMPGTDIFLIDESGGAVAAGSRGEIVIRGPNVSPGYLDRPDLTAARFFEQEGQRAYRTGDWGRFQDGLLFFEGRIDSQIKLNGHRIELGDIETNLRDLPMVRDAAVVPVVKNGKAQWLTGFVVPATDFDATHPHLEITLRERLRERLPAYMLPRKFVIVNALPITANGKVDKSKLVESL